MVVPFTVRLLPPSVSVQLPTELPPPTCAIKEPLVSTKPKMEWNILFHQPALLLESWIGGGADNLLLLESWMAETDEGDALERMIRS